MYTTMQSVLTGMAQTLAGKQNQSPIQWYSKDWPNLAEFSIIKLPLIRGAK